MKSERIRHDQFRRIRRCSTYDLLSIQGLGILRAEPRSSPVAGMEGGVQGSVENSLKGASREKPIEYSVAAMKGRIWIESSPWTAITSGPGEIKWKSNQGITNQKLAVASRDAQENKLIQLVGEVSIAKRAFTTSIGNC